MPRIPCVPFSCLIFSLLAGAVPASAEPPGSSPSTPLFALESHRSSPPLRGWLAVENAVEEFSIATRPEVLAANPAVLRFELPFGPRLEGIRRHFRDYGPEWKSWSGTLRLAGSSGPGKGYVFFGYHGERITGVLRFEGERYEITGLGQPQRLVRQSHGLAEGVNCGVHPGDEIKPLGSAVDSVAAVGASPATAQRAPQRIDVMAVYPMAYFSSPTTQISLVDHVEDTLAQANDIFDNSNINAEYNLVHVGPIVGTQPSLQGPQGGLILLNSEPLEIRTLRDAYGADFVTMFVPFSWDDFVATHPPCGVANVPVRNSSGAIDTFTGEGGLLGSNLAVSRKAFTAQRQSCGFGDFTFPHEMGHNWAMWHRIGSPSGTTLLSPTSFSFYISAVDRNTAMGCQNAGGSAGTAAVCKRIDHFSDPTARYLGVHPTGSSSKNNSKEARNRLATYAAFKPQKAISPPVARFTRFCHRASRPCGFNAGATTDNGSITKYYWNFGDGTSATTTSPRISHTYGGSGTFFWVHLIATDNSDQRDLAIDSVRF